MGVKLWEADGFSHGETKGDIVGYDMLNGTNYGGSDDPLPRGARAAFVLAKIGENTNMEPLLPEKKLKISLRKDERLCFKKNVERPSRILQCRKWRCECVPVLQGGSWTRRSGAFQTVDEPKSRVSRFHQSRCKRSSPAGSSSVTTGLAR